MFYLGLHKVRAMRGTKNMRVRHEYCMHVSHVSQKCLKGRLKYGKFKVNFNLPLTTCTPLTLSHINFNILESGIHSLIDETDNNSEQYTILLRKELKKH